MPEKTSRRGALGQGGEKPSLFGMQRRDLCVAAGGILGLLALGAAGRAGGTSAPRSVRPEGRTKANSSRAASGATAAAASATPP